MQLRYTYFHIYYLAPVTNKSVCSSKACSSIAQSLLNDIDQQIDPCDDFYGYVCNKWIKKHPATKEQLYRTPRTKISKDMPGLLKGRCKLKYIL